MANGALLPSRPTAAGSAPNTLDTTVLVLSAAMRVQAGHSSRSTWAAMRAQQCMEAQGWLGLSRYVHTEAIMCVMHATVELNAAEVSITFQDVCAESAGVLVGAAAAAACRACHLWE